MLGIYFSGTGNSKHCVESLVRRIEVNALSLPLDGDSALNAIIKNSFIVWGYGIQFSNAPYFVRDFIISHKDIWKGKQIFLVATMGAFSGDGTGCCARLFKKYGAKVVGGLHLKMPDSVCDVKALKKSPEENREIIAKADKKIEKAAMRIKQGKYPKEGLGFFAHMAGLFGQRLWFSGKTKGYCNKLKIDTEKCRVCGTCAEQCPMGNLKIVRGKVVIGEKCTMCYRCISKCPHKAITLWGKKVITQYRFEKQ